MADVPLPKPTRMKFADVCALMPEGVYWGDLLTPQIARELVEAGRAHAADEIERPRHRTHPRHRRRQMNTDRELLEMAAKAAGIEYKPELSFPKEGKPFFGLWLVIHGEPTELTRRRWNPLIDDGDALRLAVKLGIALDRTTNRCWAWVNGWSFPGVCEEFYKNDPYAATRRVIVRAAAAIGGGK